MSYANEPFVGSQPQFQIQRVGGWRLLLGAMLAAAGLGFAGYVYVVPYKKLTKTLHARNVELGEERSATQDLTADRDKLKAELDKHESAQQDKAGAETKRKQSLEMLGASLKTALLAIGATVSVADGKAVIGFATASLFDQPTSTVISQPGEATLRVLATALKQGGFKAHVKAKLIPTPPPRELAQFRNVGEFTVLRAARVALALANDGVTADHIAIAGESPSAAGRKAKSPVPDRLEVEIQAE